jgi:Dockerin type I domain
MRGRWHYRQYVQLWFEALESRAMLAVSALSLVKPAAAPTLIRGDLNLDGKVNGGDFADLAKALANLPGYEKEHHLNDQQALAVADVNGDGVISNADLQALINLIRNQPPPPPPPPPPQQVIVLTPTGPITTAPSFLLVNNTTAGPPVTSQVVLASDSGAFAPLQSKEALLAGGGGDTSTSPATVTNNGPPMPSKAKTTDVALIAFGNNHGSGGDQLEGMLMKLADVEEPQLLSIEYGDDVVKREVVANKQVTPAAVAVAEKPAPGGEGVVPAFTPPVAEAGKFLWSEKWWLVAVPVGAAGAGAAAWMYRRKLWSNVERLVR